MLRQCSQLDRSFGSGRREFVIVVAQRREPADFARVVGMFMAVALPRAATSTAYQCFTGPAHLQRPRRGDALGLLRAEDRHDPGRMRHQPARRRRCDRGMAPRPAPRRRPGRAGSRAEQPPAAERRPGERARPSASPGRARHSRRGDPQRRDLGLGRGQRHVRKCCSASICAGEVGHADLPDLAGRDRLLERRATSCGWARMSGRWICHRSIRSVPSRFSEASIASAR
jgi:hypothetical protein